MKYFSSSDVNEECLRIHRPRPNVLELISSNCRNDQSNRTMTFLSKSISTSSCSISIGHLLLQSNIHHHHRIMFTPKKSLELSVGCETKDQLMIYQKEHGKSTRKIFLHSHRRNLDSEHRLLIQTDQCLASWQSTPSSPIHIIAQSISLNHSYCLVCSKIFLHRSIILLSRVFKWVNRF